MKLRAYKFRIYPTKEQQTSLNKTFGCVRFLWNLRVGNFNNKETREDKTTTELRKEIEWLKEVSASALQQKDRDFLEYKKQFFSKDRKTKLGKPNFKKKNNRQSYRLPNQKFSINQNSIKLEKIGKVKCLFDRQIPRNSKFISVTVSKNKTNKYFVSIVVEQEIKQLPKTNNSIGIDLGLINLLTLSNGEKIQNPKYFCNNQAKIVKIQKHLSKKKKGSNRFRKNKLRLARLYEKVNNQRDFFLHNLSTYLVKTYDTLCVETLKVSNMLKNHKLAKHIQDSSWSKFMLMLEYKCKFYNKNLIKVDHFFPSSKLCSTCSYKNTELKLSARGWECPGCKTQHDRDINAALNLLNKGLKTQGVTCV